MNFEISLIAFLACFAVASLLSSRKAFSFLNNRESRFETLDGLRGFLALSVFFHHFVITYYWKSTGQWTAAPENYYQNYGKVGVAIFFMITGFLFIAKLLNSDWKIDWLKLFESRVFRIMPLYFFAVAWITAIVFYNSGGEFKSAPVDLLKQLLHWAAFLGDDINNYENTRRIISGVDWTLKYEWIFYLSLPLISVIFRWGNKLINLFFCCFIVVIYFKSIQFNYGINSKYAILFLIGGLTAYIINKKVLPDKYINTRLVSIVNLIVLLGAIFYPRTLDFIHILIISFFFILVVHGNDLFGIFRLNASKLLGEISYSIYLLHGLVLYILFTQFTVLDISSLSTLQCSLLMPILGGVVVLISTATFLYIESPFIKFGRQYKISRLYRYLTAKAVNVVQLKN